MVAYLFSSIASSEAASFDLRTDFLIFHGFSAAELSITGDGSSTVLEADGKSITLTVGLDVFSAQVSTTNFIFTDQSKTFFGDGLTSIVSDQSANAITATDYGDQLRGLGGNDTLTSGAGSDLMYGGFGDDSLVAGAGNDTLWGDGGDDTLDFTTATGDNEGYGLAGNDRLFGGVGNDTLQGGEGNDLVDARTGGGSDWVFAGQGDDVLWANDTAGNIMQAGKGTDEVHGGSAADIIRAGQDDDTLYSGGGSDTMYGGKGTDRYFTSRTAEDVNTIHGVDGKEYINLGNVGTSVQSHHVADFTDDILELDLSDFVSITNGGNIAVTDTDAAVTQELSSTGTIAATTNVVMLIDTVFADLSAVETAIELGGSHALDTAVIHNDASYLIAWTDAAGSTHLSLYVASSAGGSTDFVAAEGTLSDIVVLDEINSQIAGTLLPSNFDFVA